MIDAKSILKCIVFFNFDVPIMIFFEPYCDFIDFFDVDHGKVRILSAQGLNLVYSIVSTQDPFFGI